MIRIGTVSYTNAFPLIAYLPQTCPESELVSVIPSKLGTLMSQGEVDLALLSSIELLRNPHYTYLPEIGICSDGAVGSVLLISRVPAENIQTIALDQSSLTSVILTKILCKEYWKISPQYLTYTPPVEHGLALADAALAIGDAGLLAKGDFAYCYDLGEVWKDMTGLPFVFALWIAQPHFDLEKWTPAFIEAKQLGLKHIDSIVKQCSSILPLPEERFFQYFSENLKYAVGEKETAGMHLFFEKAGSFITS